MNNNTRRGAIGELQMIAAKEGVLALWKGVGPAMARASQLATYGSASILIIAPMDMVKTRLILPRESMSDGAYRNGFRCAYEVLITEGPREVYKGRDSTIPNLLGSP
ncbi:mitochondrial substrate carrier family protein UcpB isoform X2 [Tanacetum coccineum]